MRGLIDCPLQLSLAVFCAVLQIDTGSVYYLLNDSGELREDVILKIHEVCSGDANYSNTSSDTNYSNIPPSHSCSH